MDFLASLNPEQVKAVQHHPHAPLQVLAGPGSGKTKVLTARIAYLVQSGLAPSSICAVTFTNKAAGEMKERLTKLIGKDKTAQVRMGTFHSQCAVLLRKHATKVGLEANFTVADSEESKKIIKKLLIPHKGVLDALDSDVRDGSFLSLISNMKSRGVSSTNMIKQVQGKANPSPIDRILASVYQKYEAELRATNSCDFDDLLVFAVKLCQKHKKVVSWCKHVLVDEFQDTNVMQYEFMQHLAAGHKGVTTVGDPDQSIYGWRAAEVQNLKRMSTDFVGTKQVLLEQNYRSTGAILSASMAIVSQDKARIQKNLRTTHAKGTTPVLYTANSEAEEAEFIAVEIKRLVAEFGGVLDWSHFAILLRFNALSRSIEKAFQQHSIPHRVLAGHKFFERQEIKDLLAFLLVVDNPSYVPGFQRALALTTKNIGPKTIEEILARATILKMSPMATVERIYTKSIPDLRLRVAPKVKIFVKTAQTLHNMATEGKSPADLIEALVDMIDYEAHLKKTQPDWESRMENVRELISFATEVQAGIEESPVSPVVSPASKEEDTSPTTPLRQFLQASMLTSEGDSDKEEDNNKVTISTSHSAKGLEWPVVMIPAVEDGIFPFRRSLDIEEERRLLYVACTRAQGLLYLSHTTSRQFSGMSQRKDLSPFLSVIMKDAEKQMLFTNQVPDFTPEKRNLVAKVLGKPPPSPAEVARRVAQFNATTKPHSPPAPSAFSAFAGVPSLGFSTAKGVSWKLAQPLPSSSADVIEISDDDEDEKRHEKSKARAPLSPARPSKYNAASRSNAVAALASSGPRQTPQVQINSKWRPQHQPSDATPAVKPSAFSAARIAIKASSNLPASISTAPPAQLKPAKTQPVVEKVPSSGPMVSKPVIGVKRRLGMGTMNTGGYVNKKFKPPTL